jgi:hypothetical protein
LPEGARKGKKQFRGKPRGNPVGPGMSQKKHGPFIFQHLVHVYEKQQTLRLQGRRNHWSIKKSAIAFERTEGYYVRFDTGLPIFRAKGMF